MIARGAAAVTGLAVLGLAGSPPAAAQTVAQPSFAMRAVVVPGPDAITVRSAVILGVAPGSLVRVTCVTRCSGSRTVRVPGFREAVPAPGLAGRRLRVGATIRVDLTLSPRFGSADRRTIIYRVADRRGRATLQRLALVCSVVDGSRSRRYRCPAGTESPVPAGTAIVGVGRRHVWSYGFTPKMLAQTDAGTGRLVRTLRLPYGRSAVMDGDAVVMTTRRAGESDRLVRVEPTGTVRTVARDITGPVTVGRGRAYVFRGATIDVVDARRGGVVGTLPTPCADPASTWALFTRGPYLFVACRVGVGFVGLHNAEHAIDVRTGAVQPFGPGTRLDLAGVERVVVQLGADGRAVTVRDLREGTARTVRLRRSDGVPLVSPTGLTFDGRRIWTSTGGSNGGAVFAFDLRGREVLRVPIADDVGGDFHLREGILWTTNGRSRTVGRVDLRPTVGRASFTYLGY